MLLVKNNHLLPPSFNHHSYLVIGDQAVALLKLRERLELEMGHSLESDPDSLVLKYKNFGVDDSRELKGRILGRPLAGQNKNIIVTVGNMTNAAQNALLKVLEEPTTSTRIFIIARSIKLFLATIISRSEIIILNEDSDWPENYYYKLASDFICASPAGRLGTLFLWQKEEKITKDFLVGFLNCLENINTQKFGMSSDWKKPVVLARKYIYDQALLPRLVLEYLAVALPVARV